MPSEPNYYQILRVDSSAEPEEIKAAYRHLARKYHPDVTGNPASTARMARINAAYAALSNPESRRRYDAERLGRESSSNTGQTATGYPPRQRRATNTETSTKRPVRTNAETSEDAPTRPAGTFGRGTIFSWLALTLFVLYWIAKIVSLVSK